MEGATGSEFRSFINTIFIFFLLYMYLCKHNTQPHSREVGRAYTKPQKYVFLSLHSQWSMVSLNVWVLCPIACSFLKRSIDAKMNPNVVCILRYYLRIYVKKKKKSNRQNEYGKYLSDPSLEFIVPLSCRLLPELVRDHVLGEQYARRHVGVACNEGEHNTGRFIYCKSFMVVASTH